jgi:hypothetical protein
MALCLLVTHKVQEIVAKVQSCCIVLIRWCVLVGIGMKEYSFFFHSLQKQIKF